MSVCVCVRPTDVGNGEKASNNTRPRGRGVMMMTRSTQPEDQDVPLSKELPGMGMGMGSMGRYWKGNYRHSLPHQHMLPTSSKADVFGVGGRANTCLVKISDVPGKMCHAFFARSSRERTHTHTHRCIKPKFSFSRSLCPWRTAYFCPPKLDEDALVAFAAPYLPVRCFNHTSLSSLFLRGFILLPSIYRTHTHTYTVPSGSA